MMIRRRIAEVIADRVDRFVRLNQMIGPSTRRGRGFHRFGEGSLIMAPLSTIYNEDHISIGSRTMIGENVALAAGMAPGQRCFTKPVIVIGDRCLIGRDSSIIGHLTIEIGDDVWTGPRVYVTDQNHDYTDVSRPIGSQSQPERAVYIGDGSWIGTGAVVLPGAKIGRHCTIGANSVVTGEIPDYSVAVGAPARVIKTYLPDSGWVDVKRTGH